MATNFDHKLNYADEFYKPVKFQANPLWAYPGVTLSFFLIVFGGAAMKSFIYGYHHKHLVDRLLSQGYEVKRLKNSF